MHRTFQQRLLAILESLILVLFFASTTPTQTVATQRGVSEQRTARYFESIRKSPPQELAFLLKMPKGGDLHNHLSGAIYAESYIQWAADSGDCVNTTTMAASLPPCTTGQTPAKN